MIENTPDNWDKDRTKAIARLFLPCKRDYWDKIDCIVKKSIGTIFTVSFYSNGKHAIRPLRIL